MNENEVQALMSEFSEPVRELARRCRSLVLTIFPEAIEQVDFTARLMGYGFDRTYKGLVYAIALQRSYVNLMFSRGVDLPDPEGLLEGTGKRARHVKIKAIADLENPALTELIRVAMEFQKMR